MDRDKLMWLGLGVVGGIVLARLVLPRLGLPGLGQIPASQIAGMGSWPYLPGQNPAVVMPAPYGSGAPTTDPYAASPAPEESFAQASSSLSNGLQG